MIIGACKMVLRLYDVFSLKDKRMIVKSIVDKINSKFNISAAEVGQNDQHKDAVIGFALVSNDMKFSEGVLEKVIYFIDNDSRFEVVDILRESFFFEEEWK